jgi:hypothetical protein
VRQAFAQARLQLASYGNAAFAKTSTSLVTDDYSVAVTV